MVIYGEVPAGGKTRKELLPKEQTRGLSRWGTGQFIPLYYNRWTCLTTAHKHLWFRDSRGRETLSPGMSTKSRYDRALVVK